MIYNQKQPKRSEFEKRLDEYWKFKNEFSSDSDSKLWYFFAGFGAGFMLFMVSVIIATAMIGGTL